MVVASIALQLAHISSQPCTTPFESYATCSVTPTCSVLIDKFSKLFAALDAKLPQVYFLKLPCADMRIWHRRLSQSMRQRSTEFFEASGLSHKSVTVSY
jgi:hypothetical protein